MSTTAARSASAAVGRSTSGRRRSCGPSSRRGPTPPAPATRSPPQQFSRTPSATKARHSNSQKCAQPFRNPETRLRALHLTGVPDADFRRVNLKLSRVAVWIQGAGEKDDLGRVDRDAAGARKTEGRPDRSARARDIPSGLAPWSPGQAGTPRRTRPWKAARRDNSGQVESPDTAFRRRLVEQLHSNCVWRDETVPRRDSVNR